MELVDTEGFKIKLKTTQTLESRVCFWDHHEFTSERRYHCPVEYIPKRKKVNNSHLEPLNEVGTYIVECIFCSIECTYAWSRQNKYITQYLYDLYKIEGIITARPPFHILERYGGMLTLYEYRTTKFSNAVSCQSFYIAPHVVNLS